MDDKVQIEYDRILAGPHSGNFTFLHHDGPMVQHIDNVLKRLDIIFKEKADSQHYDRLRHIYYLDINALPQACRDADKACRDADKAARDAYRACQNVDRTPDAYRAYQDANYAWRDADKAWEKVITPYVMQLIPDCAWNGLRILFSDVSK